MIVSFIDLFLDYIYQYASSGNASYWNMWNILLYNNYSHTTRKFLGSPSRGMTNIGISFMNTSHMTKFRISIVIFACQWCQRVAKKIEPNQTEHWKRHIGNHDTFEPHIFGPNNRKRPIRIVLEETLFFTTLTLENPENLTYVSKQQCDASHDHFICGKYLAKSGTFEIITSLIFVVLLIIL